MVCSWVCKRNARNAAGAFAVQLTNDEVELGGLRSAAGRGQRARHALDQAAGVPPKQQRVRGPRIHEDPVVDLGSGWTTREEGIERCSAGPGGSRTCR